MKPKELNFAYKLRYALDESANNLHEATIERLSSARHIALSSKKQESLAPAFVPQAVLAGHALPLPRNYLAWIGRMGLAIPLAALILGLVGIYQFEQRQQMIESASIDAEMLTDSLPLSAYLDNGFAAYLAKGGD